MILEPKHNLVSDCCGSMIYEDTDICSACKEHCEPQDAEDETDFITNETI
jgi:hypothetical protein